MNKKIAKQQKLDSFDCSPPNTQAQTTTSNISTNTIHTMLLNRKTKRDIVPIKEEDVEEKNKKIFQNKNHKKHDEDEENEDDDDTTTTTTTSDGKKRKCKSSFFTFSPFILQIFRSPKIFSISPPNFLHSNGRRDQGPKNHRCQQTGHQPIDQTSHRTVGKGVWLLWKNCQYQNSEHARQN